MRFKAFRLVAFSKPCWLTIAAVQYEIHLASHHLLTVQNAVFGPHLFAQYVKQNLTSFRSQDMKRTAQRGWQLKRIGDAFGIAS